MWNALQEEAGRDVTKYKIQHDGNTLSFSEIITLLKTSNEFIHFFNSLLKNSAYSGFFWEVKPVTSSDLNKAFEFVLVNGTMLNGIKPERSVFEQYFKNKKFVVSFPNLGGDARLIVPVAESNSKDYAHLANFVRSAPGEQLEAFWKTVGEEYSNAIGKEPKWLSTAGLGVYWVHARVDSGPKYYKYQPYKTYS